MKYLTDKSEIAKFFNRHSVLRINRRKCVDGYKDFYEGDRARVATPSKRYPDLNVHGKLIYCEGKYEVMSAGIFISNSFGYSDLMERYEICTSQLLHEGDEVAIIEDFGEKTGAIVRIMRVKNCSSQCSTVCELVDID